MRFQSVSGLKADIEMETYKEGGNNMFEYQLPVRVKFSDISLKRGLLVGSLVTDWLLVAFNTFTFLPMDLTIELLNDQGTPLMGWMLMGALPKSWSISDFDAENSRVVIEQIDLVVREFLIL
jgi:phage tail-like protein